MRVRIRRNARASTPVASSLHPSTAELSVGRRALRLFRTDRTATSAVEFALVLPFLIVLLFGSVELHRYNRYARHLEMSADTIASMASQRTGPVANADLTLEQDSTMLTFREARPPNGPSTNAYDIRKIVVLQITNVVFKPTVAGCVSNCTYTANVAWVWPRNGEETLMGTLKRSCGTLAGSAAGAAISATTIPQKLFGPGSVLVVDMVYTYSPLLGGAFISPVKMTRQAFASPRFADPYLKWDPNGWNGVTRCAGF